MYTKTHERSRLVYWGSCSGTLLPSSLVVNNLWYVPIIRKPDNPHTDNREYAVNKGRREPWSGWRKSQHTLNNSTPNEGSWNADEDKDNNENSDNNNVAKNTKWWSSKTWVIAISPSVHVCVCVCVICSALHFCWSHALETRTCSYGLFCFTLLSVSCIRKTDLQLWVSATRSYFNTLLLSQDPSDKPIRARLQ
jgi:hypothetical protein